MKSLHFICSLCLYGNQTNKLGVWLFFCQICWRHIFHCSERCKCASGTFIPFSEWHKYAVFTCLPLLLSVPAYLCCSFYLSTSAVVCTCLLYLWFRLYLSTSAVICTCLPLLLSVPVYLCYRLYLSTSAVVCTCLPLLSTVPVYLCCRLYLSTSSFICSCLSLICSCRPLLPSLLFPVHLHHRSNSICFLFTFIILATASVSYSPLS